MLAADSGVVVKSSFNKSSFSFLFWPVWRQPTIVYIAW